MEDEVRVCCIIAKFSSRYAKRGFSAPAISESGGLAEVGLAGAALPRPKYERAVFETEDIVMLDCFVMLRRTRRDKQW